MTNEQAFADCGYPHKEAFRILCEGCEIPPSLEVFNQELEDARLGRGPQGPRQPNPGLRPEQLARRLVENYQRVQGWFHD